MKRVRSALRLVFAAMLIVMLAGAIDVRGAAAASVADDKDSVRVTVVILPQAAPADSLIYDIVATNRGKDWVKNATITVPFDGAALKLADVQFKGDSGWVKETGSNAFVLQIARLNASSNSTATVRFAKLPGAPKNAGLAERATFAWLGGDVTVGGSGSTNLPALEPMAVYPMEVIPIGDTSRPTEKFSASYFAPGEPVSFWCNMPDGTIHPLLIGDKELVALEHKISNFDKQNHKYGEYMRADEHGAIAITLPPEHLGAGSYSVVAYGHWTGLSALGGFEFK